MTGPEPVLAMSDVTLWCADARAAWQWLPAASVDAIVTSPPYYGLRDYGVTGQLGLEATPGEYVDGLADLLTSWGTTVLKPYGSLWLNLGDTYATRSVTGTPGQSRQVSGNHRRRSAAGASRTPDHNPDDARPREKSLLMIPERAALALIDRGWVLRNKIVWAKPNGMPSSVTDRLACKWEHLFHLVRAPRYYYDLDAIREPLTHPDAADGSRIFGGRNKAGRGRGGSSARTADGTSAWGAPPAARDARADLAGSGHSSLTLSGRGDVYHPAGRNPGDVWSIPTSPNPAAHFATFPAELVRRPILATVPAGGVVADPFAGTGTTAAMARRLGRRALLVELNADYCQLAAARFTQDVFDLNGAADA